MINDMATTMVCPMGARFAPWSRPSSDTGVHVFGYISDHVSDHASKHVVQQPSMVESTIASVKHDTGHATNLDWKFWAGFTRFCRCTDNLVSKRSTVRSGPRMPNRIHEKGRGNHAKAIENGPRIEGKPGQKRREIEIGRASCRERV